MSHTNASSKVSQRSRKLRHRQHVQCSQEDGAAAIQLLVALGAAEGAAVRDVTGDALGDAGGNTVDVAVDAAVGVVADGAAGGDAVGGAGTSSEGAAVGADARPPMAVGESLGHSNVSSQNISAELEPDVDDDSCDDDAAPKCRICYEAGDPISGSCEFASPSPCNCKGSSAYVHVYCLQRCVSLRVLLWLAVAAVVC